MPSFFIDRPIFGWVVAILISLCGAISMLNLGIESYPNVVPPQITVTANYGGASADTAEKTVAQIIEQNLTGIDHLLYFSTQSSSNGRVVVTLTFETGTNPDIAQVQVQNKVSLASSRLPAEVNQQGVVVAKAAAGFLMFVALESDKKDIDRDRLNDVIASNVLEQISRIPGVGATNQLGAEYAMRVWLDPTKLQGYGLSAADVENAISAQNVQFAAGALGSDRAVPNQEFTATVSAEGRLNTPEQFRKIILRSDSNGTVVTLGDVARVAFGAFTYGFDTQLNGKPTGAFGIQLLSGANALDVKNAVTTRMNELAKAFPPGVHWVAPYDSTTFVTASIHEVIETLVIAIILVVLVMLLFLQSVRATIIPTLVIPVALLGTFIGMSALGFTINQLSLFGMVLAIGIVVDDAIVVIENVERIMSEEHLSPKEATRKAMGQITGAVVAITVVLAAVFVPSALQSGTSGLIYRQFALTIALSMAFSAFLALSFTPALCATILKPGHSEPNWFYRWFNRVFDRVNNTYRGHVYSAVGKAPRWMIVFVLLAVLCGFLYIRLPTSFLPAEDQGYALAIVQLPPGASLQRNKAVMDQARIQLQKDPAVDSVFQIGGFSFIGIGENVSMMFIKLKPWEDRDILVPDFVNKYMAQFHSTIRDGQIFLTNLPTVQGLSPFGGFDMFLQARAGQSHQELMKSLGEVIGKASKDKALVAVRPNGLADAPQLQLNVDRVQAQSMGLSVSDVYTAIQLMLAPVYVNDFFYAGRVKRVELQADAPYRMDTDAFKKYYLPSTSTASSASSAGATDTTTASNGVTMIPLSNVVHSKWFFDSPSLNRFNGYSAVEIVGQEAPGYSSGQAMAEMTKIIDGLPKTYGMDWVGQSYQEIIAGNAATMLMLLSIVIVFLCLAALYESWSIPVSVLLVVPIGILGAVAATMLRGLSNDLFFKIGMITVIGLAAKNAILIVEFAVAQQAEGKTLREAVVEAAHLRLRPIIMTSLAFILGVVPLAISTGAGAASRHAIGTGVIGGMLFSTFLGLLLIPVFFVSVRRLLGDKLDGNDDQPKDGNSKSKEMAPFDSDPNHGH